MTNAKPEPIDCCSPHTIRKLVHTVLAESRAINLKFSSPKKSKHEDREDDEVPPDVPVQDTALHLSSGKRLSVHDVRQLSGCLIRVPNNFYSDIWGILKKTRGGIFVKDLHLPREPTISNMARYTVTAELKP
jgi:hypothetical protein